MSDNITTPPTPAEVDEFIKNLSDDDKKELRRQQLVNAAVTRKPDVAPEWPVGRKLGLKAVGAFLFPRNVTWQSAAPWNAVGQSCSA